MCEARRDPLPMLGADSASRSPMERCSSWVKAVSRGHLLLVPSNQVCLQVCIALWGRHEDKTILFQVERSPSPENVLSQELRGASPGGVFPGKTMPPEDHPLGGPSPAAQLCESETNSGFRKG